MKRVALLIAICALAAACTSATAAGKGPATIGTRHTALGTFLVSSGRTLYLFEADGRNQSTCTGHAPEPGGRCPRAGGGRRAAA